VLALEEETGGGHQGLPWLPDNTLVRCPCGPSVNWYLGAARGVPWVFHPKVTAPGRSTCQTVQNRIGTLLLQPVRIAWVSLGFGTCSKRNPFGDVRGLDRRSASLNGARAGLKQERSRHRLRLDESIKYLKAYDLRAEGIIMWRGFEGDLRKKARTRVFPFPKYSLNF